MQTSDLDSDSISKKPMSTIETSQVNLTNAPSCSVIIPVYNASSTLALCLESISQLNYPKERLEIIVIDNGSTDDGIDIARCFDVEILSETAVQSSYAARNTGIRAARGDLIAFTDADCIVTPDWLKHLVAYWLDDTIGCFAGEIESYQPESVVEKFSDREGILRQRCTLENPFLPYPQTANAAYRKRVFDQVGLFVPEMTSGGDADIAWRMQKRLGLQVKFIPQALVYHKHRTSIQGLYNQFIKYEYGKYYWTQHYPDYQFPTLGERQQELADSIQQHCNLLKNDIISLINERIDFVSFITPFLKMLMRAGTFKARIDIEKSLDRIVEIPLATQNPAATVVDLLATIGSKDATISEMEAIIAQKDARINDLLATIGSKDATISEMEAIIAQKDARINDLLNSRSW